MSSVTLIPQPPRRHAPLSSLVFTNEFGLAVLIFGFGTLFWLLSSGFLSSFNIVAMSRAAAINIAIGLSMMVVIATGGLSLSIGAIGVCAAMTFGWLVEILGVPLPLALVLAVISGALLGSINGAIVVWSGLHSFIVTLATMSLFFGSMVFLTEAESFREIPASLVAFGRLKIMGISAMMVAVLAVAGLVGVFFHHSRIGKEILAAGASPDAALLSGVRVGRMIVCSHALSGALAAFAALLLVSRNGAAIPSMAGQLGQDWLLIAFLGPVLGGTLLSGGKVSVSGTFLGALLVTMLSNGMLLMRISEFWLQACLGVVLLIAVTLDLLRRRFLARRALK